MTAIVGNFLEEKHDPQLTYPIALQSTSKIRVPSGKKLPWAAHFGLGSCISAATAASYYLSPVFIAFAVAGVLFDLKWQKVLASEEREVEVTFLNGKTIEVPLQRGSSRLRENIQMGKEIVAYVRNTIEFSPNYVQRSELLAGADSSAFERKIKDLWEVLHSIRNQIIVECQKEHEVNVPVLALAKLAETYRVGNCMEMSAVGYKYAIERFGLECPIEWFRIQNGDHWYLVIDRDPRSEEHDYQNWGPDAVIADPWTGACYPASQLEQYLSDAREPLKVKGMRYTRVKPFNPKEQLPRLNPVPHNKYCRIRRSES